MISKFRFNSSPFIPIMNPEEGKRASSEPTVLPSDALPGLFCVQLILYWSHVRGIFTIAEQLIYFLSQEHHSFPDPPLCPLCVPGEFPHILEDSFQISLSLCKFPCGPRQNESLFPGYALQVCAYPSTSSSGFILGSCSHVCCSP